MSLQFLHYIDLPENTAAGGFDHAAVHIKTDRLYVAHTANDSLDVIDCCADRYLTSIPDLAGVAGVLVSQKRDLVFTSNRSENTIGIFRPGDEGNIKKIPVDIHPNGLAFDPVRGLLLAANIGDQNIPDSFSLSMVDVQTQKLIHNIPCPGRTRWAIFDVTRTEFYVNIADPAMIVVVSAEQPDRIARRVDIPAAGPHGLDQDPTSGVLFSACDSAQLVALEEASGKMLGMVELSGKPDVIFFNPALKHLYVAIGDPGLIEVFDTHNLTRIESIPTEKKVHTIAFDPVRNKVFAFLPETQRAAVFIDL
jgi:DNA-binding beta-propeller fold protein YncE